MVKAKAKKNKSKNKSKVSKSKINQVNSNAKKPKLKAKKLDKQGNSSNISKKHKVTSGKQKARNPSGKGGFKKGKSGNPKGRPPSGETKLDTLLNAIARHQVGIKPDPKNPVDHFIKRAFKNDNVLVALMKKVYPDLKAIEQVTYPGEDITKEEEEQIRKEYEKRFGKAPK